MFFFLKPQPFNVLFYSYNCNGKGPYRYPSEKKRSPVLKDCLFVNMILLGCKAVDIQKVNRLFFQLGHLKV